MIRLLSLFSGIGAFETALRRGGHEYQLIGYCEIDKYAAKAYAQMHGVSEQYNLVDVNNVDTILMDDVDLITYGFPCQDISIAGKQKGFEDAEGKRTRSGLFFEALRIIEETRPLYAIAENVKALTSKKFEKEFKTVLDSLNDAGYNNYWAVLNAKDYGIPQNRERVFIVSIRKDIDNGSFKFPDGMPLNKRLKDMLEADADAKYYIKSEKADRLINNLYNNLKSNKNNKKNIIPVGSINGHQSGAVIHEDGCCRCLCVSGHVEPQKIITSMPHVQRIGNLYSDTAGGARAGNTYDPEGLAPTLQTAQGGNRQPLIIDPVICRSIGRNPENPSDRTAGAPTEQRLEPNSQGISNTLTTVQKDNYVLEQYRIRKLTPLECFRLMGFNDGEFNKLKGISNTQLYKMAGNSIVVNVLEGIFNNLLRK